MCLTVEPGIYFIESQVEEVLAKPEWQDYIASRERLEGVRGTAMLNKTKGRRDGRGSGLLCCWRGAALT